MSRDRDQLNYEAGRAYGLDSGCIPGLKPVSPVLLPFTETRDMARRSGLDYYFILGWLDGRMLRAEGVQAYSEVLGLLPGEVLHAAQVPGLGLAPGAPFKYIPL